MLLKENGCINSVGNIFSKADSSYAGGWVAETNGILSP